MGKPIVCVDFDGVIHTYQKGWQGGVIYGDMMPGFREWAREAKNHFTLVVYSSRSKEPKLLEEMKAWLKEKAPELDLECSASKPPAFITIDDRAFEFRGNFPDITWLKSFKPWVLEGDPQ